MTVAASLSSYKITAKMAKLGRLSFFVFETGNNGNHEHCDLYQIIPCNVLHNTTSLLTEEGKKMTPSECKEATATEMVSLRAFAELIISHLGGKVNADRQIVLW